MKKLLYFAFLSVFAFFGTVIADTLNIDWLVDGETYSSTTCNYGDDLILPNTPTKYGYTFVGWEPKFTKIEYLQKTGGTQYINTGIVPNNNTKIILSWRDDGNTGWVFGTRCSVFFGLLCSPNTDIKQKRIDYITGDAARFVHTASLANRKLTAIINENHTAILYNDSGALLTSVNLSTTTWSETCPMYLFAMDNHGELDIQSNTLRIYYFQIYDNDILIRDFIPVLDDNGVACMYDKVSRQFFYNAGTGDFIAGPTISE